MLAYFVFTNHVNVFPWNNLERAGRQFNSTLMGLIPGVLVSVAIWTRSRLGLWFASIWLLVWLVLQLLQWWLPYLTGQSILAEDFSWYFVQGYQQTLHWLPLRADRPVPDAQHNLLQLLSMLCLLTTARLTLGVTMRKLQRLG